jgi:hypothetical protein
LLFIPRKKTFKDSQKFQIQSVNKRNMRQSFLIISLRWVKAFFLSSPHFEKISYEAVRRRETKLPSEISERKAIAIQFFSSAIELVFAVFCPSYLRKILTCNISLPYSERYTSDTFSASFPPEKTKKISTQVDTLIKYFLFSFLIFIFFRLAG